MCTNVGEMIYSISVVLRFLQSYIIPSACLGSYLVGSFILNLVRD